MRRRSSLPIQVENEIRAANRGRMPTTRADFLRAASRFDCRVNFWPPPFRPEQSSIQDGVIHVPEIGPDHPVLPCHIHELAEAALAWEGREPYVVPAPQKNSRHEVARCVNLLEPRRILTRDLKSRIARVGIKLGELFGQAGFDIATVERDGDGQVFVTLSRRPE